MDPLRRWGAAPKGTSGVFFLKEGNFSGWWTASPLRIRDKSPRPGRTESVGPESVGPEYRQPGSVFGFRPESPWGYVDRSTLKRKRVHGPGNGTRKDWIFLYTNQSFSGSMGVFHGDPDFGRCFLKVSRQDAPVRGECICNLLRRRCRKAGNSSVDAYLEHQELLKSNRTFKMSTIWLMVPNTNVKCNPSDSANHTSALQQEGC